MYERRQEPLLSRSAFLQRFARHAIVAIVIMAGSLFIGILGYHLTEGLDWVDSLLNAAMILGGMGPVNELHTSTGKVFASLYALYSGLVVLVVAGVLFAPIFHRLLHHFHVEMDDEGSEGENS